MDKEHLLTLRLTVEETNVILDALGQQPYVKVFGVIQKIQQQAEGQIGQVDGQVAAIASENAPMKGKKGT